MKPIVVCLFLFFGALDSVNAQKVPVPINFGHLDHLTERILFDGDTVGIVHVYANAPSYDWVGAEESGMEGIACVDDAARAAVMYLRHFELTRDTKSLEKAKLLLRFVGKMETEDGNFYNFILRDHSINKDGKTSFNSFGWWACRGVWSMAKGFRIFKVIDPIFAATLKAGVERTFPHIDSLIQRRGETRTIKTFTIARWLLYESGTDVTSELLLGLNEYYAATHDARVKKRIAGFAEGLMLMQDGDILHYPYGAHRSWETMWHMWGNGQTQSLATAGKLLKNRRMIASAEREAQGWYSRLLIDGYLKELDLSDSTKRTEYEQIAYAVRPMALGLLRLSEATGKKEYAKMAGLAASWFFGNNVLHEQMYDSATGRGYDGIRDSVSLNKNSGAESTIEALATLVEIQHSPLAAKYLRFKKVASGKTSRYLYAAFGNGPDERLTLAIDLKKSKLLFLEGKASSRFLRSL